MVDSKFGQKNFFDEKNIFGRKNFFGQKNLFWPKEFFSTKRIFFITIVSVKMGHLDENSVLQKYIFN